MLDNPTQETLRIYPSKRPGLILGGGPGISSLPYRNYLNPLLDGGPMTAWDYRGTGGSPRSPKPSFDEDYRDALTVLQKIHPDEVVDVIAHSYGCTLALRLATERPERVRTLTLIGAALSFDKVIEKIVARKFANMPTGDFLRITALAVRARLFGSSPEVDRRFLALEARNQLHVRPPTFAKDQRDGFDLSLDVLLANQDFARRDFREAAARIRAPTLVIQGENDIIVPEAFGREVVATIPGARFKVIPNSGHWPFYEQPEAFKEALR